MSDQRYNANATNMPVSIEMNIPSIRIAALVSFDAEVDGEALVDADVLLAVDATELETLNGKALGVVEGKLAEVSSGPPGVMLLRTDADDVADEAGEG